MERALTGRTEKTRTYPFIDPGFQLSATVIYFFGFLGVLGVDFVPSFLLSSIVIRLLSPKDDLLHFLLSLFTTKYTLFSLFFQVFLCLFLCENKPIFLLLALLFSQELTHNVFYASCMAHPKAKTPDLLP